MRLTNVRPYGVGEPRLLALRRDPLCCAPAEQVLAEGRGGLQPRRMGGKHCAGRTQCQPLAQGSVCRGHRVTQADVDNYGPEVLDMAQRASLHALAPELQRLADQNAEMRGRLARETQRNLFQTLDRAIPDWRTINRSPE